MNENIFTMTFNVADPTEASAVSQSALLQVLPIDATLVYVTASPFNDDSGAVMDIQDDGTDIVTGVDVSDHDVPGTWISTHAGGSETPVFVAGGSEIELDFDLGAAANRFDVLLVFLSGRAWG